MGEGKDENYLLTEQEGQNDQGIAHISEKMLIFVEK